MSTETQNEPVLVSDIREAIIGRYSRLYRMNDGAHQVQHFNAVEVCGNEINNRLKLGFDPKLIMLVAYLHDMYAFIRFNHHEMSAHFVRTTDDPIIMGLSPEDRELVALGCQEHRASRKERFTCEFSALMNAADRELPGNVPQMLERAIQYRLDDQNLENTPEDRSKVYADAVAHIKEKFGDGGYANYPELYLKCFAVELEQQRKDIALL
jgi:exopolyphosphatase/pppGpp-phosphohydrolase